MSMNQIQSVVVGRAAGVSLGVSDSDLGRLTLVAFVMGNPILALLAARSMAAAGKASPEPDDPLEQAVEDAKAAAADAEAAKQAAADAEAAAAKAAAVAAGAQQTAAASEASAKAAADSAQASATAAQESAAEAKKSADAAQQTAAGKKHGGSSAV